MDAEVILWMVVYLGGYSVVLGYLLWIAIRDRGHSPGH